MSVVGFTCSTFDLFHAGHVHMLQQVRSACDEMIVGLQTTITDRPDKNRPVQTGFERWKQLSGMIGHGVIVPYESEEDLHNLLVTLPEDHVRFLGEDYETKKFTGSNMYMARVSLRELINRPKVYVVDGPTLCFLPRRHGWSTSSLRSRVAQAEGSKSWSGSSRPSS